MPSRGLVGGSVGRWVGETKLAVLHAAVEAAATIVVKNCVMLYKTVPFLTQTCHQPSKLFPFVRVIWMVSIF